MQSCDLFFGGVVLAKASSGVTGCFGCALALDCITTTLAGLMKTFGAGCGAGGGGCAFGGVFGAAEEGAGLVTPMGGGGGGGTGGAGPPVVCQSPLKLPPSRPGGLPEASSCQGFF